MLEKVADEVDNELDSDIQNDFFVNHEVNYLKKKAQPMLKKKSTSP